jgi:hypothetical protein
MLGHPHSQACSATLSPHPMIQKLDQYQFSKLTKIDR